MSLIFCITFKGQDRRFEFERFDPHLLRTAVRAAFGLHDFGLRRHCDGVLVMITPQLRPPDYEACAWQPLAVHYASATTPVVNAAEEEVTAIPAVTPSSPSGAVHTQQRRVGQYIIGKQLGAGSFGTVHEGVHGMTAERVAVKVLVRAKTSDADIRNELDTMRRCQGHTNIVVLKDFLQTETHAYIVMEHVARGELFSQLVEHAEANGNSGFEEDVAREIFRQVLDGVEHCHSNGIHHGDLKLDNLLVSADNTIKIADFGLARCCTSQNLCSGGGGTPEYRAPEVSRRMSQSQMYNGKTADVWAAGVVLFVLCGYKYPSDRAVNFAPLPCMSKDLADLLRGMFVSHPLGRLNLVQIRSHKWMQGNASASGTSHLSSRIGFAQVVAGQHAMM